MTTTKKIQTEKQKTALGQDGEGDGYKLKLFFFVCKHRMEQKIADVLQGELL